MSKYIKLEDAINGDCILIDKIKCDDCPFYDEEPFLCKMVEWLKSLPTIEIDEDCISRATALKIYSDLCWINERLLNYKNELDKVYEKLRTTPSEICEEIGCKDCVNCSLGNPCLNCEDYDRQNDVCKSSSGCAERLC